MPLLLATTVLLAIGLQDAELTDPAPPRVRELEEMEPPAPREHDGLARHAAPRPLAADAVVEDWPCFLGARRDGRSRETRLDWSWGGAGPPLVWETECGSGFAAPVVAGERVVFTHREGDRTHVDCLRAGTGKRYWRHSFPTEYRPRYIDDPGPRSTPAIAGDRVVVHGVEGQLCCLELATGRVVWERDLRAEFRLSDGFFGVVSSPLVHRGLVLVNVGAPGPSVAAFDLATGRLAWGAGREWGASCASPVLAGFHGRERVFVLTGGESRPPTGGLMVLDPATGALDLAYPFRSRTELSVNGASPVVADDRVFLTASYNTGAACLELDAEGGFRELWRARQPAIEFSTPVHRDGHLYLVDGVADRAGAIVCVELATGKEVARTDLDWTERTLLDGEERELSFSIGNGSLIEAEGRFLCMGDNGHLLALEASPEGARVLARAWLFRAKRSWTPLVLSRGLLFVRQTTREGFGEERRGTRLLCYDLRGQ